MDAPEPELPASPARRARRALAFIAAALAAIVAVTIVYLRPAIPAASVHSSQPGSAPWVLDQRYEAAYDFASPTVAWALVYDIVGAQYWVFGTTDRAHRWNRLLSGEYSAQASFGIHFFGASDGYFTLAGGGTFRTSDGGRHWSEVALPSRAVAVVWFVDKMHGWFQGDDDFESTVDGGATWHPLPRLPMTGAVIEFADARNGWLGALGNDAQASVFSTADGGASWTPHPIIRTGDHFPPVDGLKLLPGGGVLVTLQNETAFTSFDGGTTWRQLVAAPPGNSYSRVAIQDATHWWAMASGDLYKTDDGGRSWRHVALQFDGWSYEPAVLDAQHAWAQLESSGPPTTGSSLAVTSDGGLHWSYASVPRVS